MVLQAGVSLLLKDAVVCTVPDARPAGIRPGKAKGKIRLAACQNLIKRTLKQALAPKPIMPITKTLNPSLPRQGSLRLAHFWNAEVIETQIGGDMRLIMPAKEGFGFGNVGPLGEAIPPPGVVFRDRVILRKIVGDQAGRVHALFTTD